MSLALEAVENGSGGFLYVHLCTWVACIPNICGSSGCQCTKLFCLQVDLPVEDGVVLLDIAFTDTDPKHGFLTGTRQTLLETFNGGKTWEPRFIESVDEEGINYRYNSISFNGSEGWIVGKPGV